ncbi:alkaline phosphatase family protein [Glaciibacter psychrotolerans]|uniref:phospholipase C n=1 Tax=Glaciibacter psychrotolerans TaxID=670054 RepID=A0A7Z0J641_9MICO|nr:alkaline phosphatase family protein [Leifsonia psychrotolerans]NYJ19523.1 phospholipase C [Leifsonia psychrotolerans]
MDENQPPSSAPKDLPDATRRTFLKRLGIGVAGAATLGAAGVAIGSAVTGPRKPLTFEDEESDPTKAFDHVVVVMFENRSFDNVLGWLYKPTEVPAGSSFDGLHQGSYSNPIPGTAETIAAHVYSGSTDVVMSSPIPDPGEAYSHVNTQIFGTVDPESNRDLHKNGLSAPYNAPSPGQKPTMSGFVEDYIINYEALAKGARTPTKAEFSLAMGGFSPEMLPVFSALAKEFAVFDHWFGAVPSQTYCNRSFFHASTSNGFVTNRGNGGYEKWFDPQRSAAPTIFNRLTDEGLDWRVYYDKAQLISLTGMMHATATQKYWKTNFRTMEQFYLDVAEGNLPAYSFVEPRMVFNHNDMHPPYGELQVGNNGESGVVVNAAVSDVRAGDKLLHELYTALRTSNSSMGSHALNTAMLVTFDEHGGTYDHVPPPAATPPGTGEKGEMGFAFDRLGPRVPAILISAYTARNTIINTTKHHGSLISTLTRQHGLMPLTHRDEEGSDMFDAINLTTARPLVEWPITHAAYVPADIDGELDPRAEQNKAKKLSNPAQGLLGMLITKFGDPAAPVPDSYEDAYAALTELGQGLFGTVDP